LNLKTTDQSLFALIPVVIVCATLLNFPAGAQTVASKTVVGEAYISSEYIVNARADSIMMWLTVPELWARISGYEFSSGAKRLLRIGDAARVIPQKDTYGQRDTGVIMISFIRPAEIWYTFEPENGAYVYQDQWKFLPSAGNETKVLFIERYIDSEGRQTSGNIEELKKLIRERLVKLKGIAERK
jgi:hypothetical protein